MGEGGLVLNTLFRKRYFSNKFSENQNSNKSLLSLNFTGTVFFLKLSGGYRDLLLFTALEYLDTFNI